MKTAERPAGAPWSREEAAKFLSCSVSFLEKKTSRRKRTSAKGPAIKTIMIGRKVYIPDHEVRRIATQGLK